MGLYDDDNADITSGDLVDVGYWQAKFEAERLEAALKSKQNEGYIRTLLPSVISLSADVLRTYPNHAAVKGWKEKAEKIQPKINPSALEEPVKDNFKYWKVQCRPLSVIAAPDTRCRGQHSYEAGYRHSGIARCAAADGQGTLAKSHARDAVTQLTRAEAAMESWPEDVQAWVKSTLAEMQKIVG